MYRKAHPGIEGIRVELVVEQLGCYQDAGDEKPVHRAATHPVLAVHLHSLQLLHDVYPLTGLLSPPLVHGDSHHQKGR